MRLTTRPRYQLKPTHYDVHVYDPNPYMSFCFKLPKRRISAKYDDIVDNHELIFIIAIAMFHPRMIPFVDDKVGGIDGGVPTNVRDPAIAGDVLDVSVDIPLLLQGRNEFGENRGRRWG